MEDSERWWLAYCARLSQMGNDNERNKHSHKNASLAADLALAAYRERWPSHVGPASFDSMSLRDALFRAIKEKDEAIAECDRLRSLTDHLTAVATEREEIARMFDELGERMIAILVRARERR